MQEKKASANFVLLFQSRNIIGDSWKLICIDLSRFNNFSLLRIKKKKHFSRSVYFRLQYFLSEFFQ